MKRQLGKLQHRWEDNIKKGFREISCEDMNRIQLVQKRVQWQALAYMVMNLLVLQKSDYEAFKNDLVP
jgi:hypothetical protein